MLAHVRTCRIYVAGIQYVVGVIKMFTRSWLKASGVRVVRTIAQAGISMIGTSAVILQDVNWIHVVSAMCLSGIVSFLMSLAGLPEVGE